MGSRTKVTTGLTIAHISQVVWMFGQEDEKNTKYWSVAQTSCFSYFSKHNGVDSEADTVLHFGHNWSGTPSDPLMGSTFGLLFVFQMAPMWTRGGCAQICFHFHNVVHIHECKILNFHRNLRSPYTCTPALKVDHLPQTTPRGQTMC